MGRIVSKHDLLGSMLIFTTQSCFSPQEPASSITYIRSRKIHEWIQSVDQMSLRKGVAFPKDPKEKSYAIARMLWISVGHEKLHVLSISALLPFCQHQQSNQS